MNIRALIVSAGLAGLLIALMTGFLQSVYGALVLWIYTIFVSILGVWIYRGIDGTVTGNEGAIVGVAGGALSPLFNAFIGGLLLGRPVMSLFEALLPEKGVGVPEEFSMSLFAFFGSALIAGIIGGIGGGIGGAFLGQPTK